MHHCQSEVIGPFGPRARPHPSRGLRLLTFATIVSILVIVAYFALTQPQPAPATIKNDRGCTSRAAPSGMDS